MKTVLEQMLENYETRTIEDKKNPSPDRDGF